MASPTYAPALAARTADLVERGAQGFPHRWRRADLLVRLGGEDFRGGGVKPQLKPTNEREFRTAARRPKFSALSQRRRWKRWGSTPMPSLDQAIRMYLLARGAAAK